MRRRWPALAATIPLVLAPMLALALAAASPASAGTTASGEAAPASGPGAPVQPGGPVSSLSTPGMPSGTVTPQGLGQPGPGQQVSATQPHGLPGGTQSTVVTSSNWAGYVATGASGAFTSVSSNWTQPAGRCTGAGGKYAAFWVGLDGYSSPTVEQTGTAVDCFGFSPRYYAWYEMYPGASVNFPVTTNPVSPGDRFSASVTYQAPSTYNLVLTDTSKGWSKSVSATLASAARSSAEVIAEAPCCTYNGGILPLTNFGTVSFTSSAVNGRSMALTHPTEIVMPNTSVSAMDSAGDFTVSYTGFPGFAGFPWRGPRLISQPG